MFDFTLIVLFIFFSVTLLIVQNNYRAFDCLIEKEKIINMT